MADGFKKLIVAVFKVLDFAVKRPLLSLIVLVVGLAVFAFANYEIIHYSSSPGFCRMCHPGTTTGPLSEVHTWEKNIHAKAEVSCLDCHGKPGALGYLVAKMGGLVDLYGEIFKSKEHKMEILKEAHEDPKYAAKLVPNETCLFCHSDASNKKTRAETFMSIGVHFRMLDGVVNPEFRKSKGLTDIIEEGVKPATDVEPKHKSHIAAGITCVDCHLGVAHSGEFQTKTKMKTCFKCHDKLRPGKMPANENCSACHRKMDRVAPTEPISFGSGDSAVKFDHMKHLKNVQCSDCHTKLFQTKKGTAKITFADHNSGKYCYACHNGKTAFASDKCARCHSGKSPMPTVLNYSKKGMVPVSFNHEGHAKKRVCTDCHTKLFGMKKGSSGITMNGMYQGRFCGSCHNGKSSFNVTDCSKCHKGFKPGNITFKTSAGEAVFSHEIHLGMFKCTDCHTKIFPFKAGSRKATMAEMEAGKSCGACHNKGKDAFSVQDDCGKCHKM